MTSRLARLAGALAAGGDSPSHAARTAAIPFAEKEIRPNPGQGGWWAEMKKTGFAMPQPTVSSRSKWRRQPSGASSES